MHIHAIFMGHAAASRTYNQKNLLFPITALPFRPVRAFKGDKLAMGSMKLLASVPAMQS
jgi:hypothetical protein